MTPHLSRQSLRTGKDEYHLLRNKFLTKQAIATSKHFPEMLSTPLYRMVPCYQSPFFPWKRIQGWSFLSNIKENAMLRFTFEWIILSSTFCLKQVFYFLKMASSHYCAGSVSHWLRGSQTNEKIMERLSDFEFEKALKIKTTQNQRNVQTEISFLCRHLDISYSRSSIVKPILRSYLEL